MSHEISFVVTFIAVLWAIGWMKGFLLDINRGVKQQEKLGVKWSQKKSIIRLIVYLVKNLFLWWLTIPVCHFNSKKK